MLLFSCRGHACERDRSFHERFADKAVICSFTFHMESNLEACKSLLMSHVKLLRGWRYAINGFQGAWFFLRSDLRGSIGKGMPETWPPICTDLQDAWAYRNDKII